LKIGYWLLAVGDVYPKHFQVWFRILKDSEDLFVKAIGLKEKVYEII